MPNSHSYNKDDITHGVEKVISKKQIDASNVTISDEKRTQLIQDARQATKEKRYKDVLNITNEILSKRPNDETASFLNENAQSFLEEIRHKKAIGQIKKVNVQERNKYFENLKEKTIPYNELMQFTTEDEWEGIKGRRRREDGNKRLEGNRENTRRLKLTPSLTQRPIPQEFKTKLEKNISIEFINTPLRDVIAFLQEKSKMNFFLDKDAPDINVNIKLHDVPISIILEYILPKGLSYTVKDNIVLIAIEPLELRVYDVRDLLINLEDRQDLTTQATLSTEEGVIPTGEAKDTFDRVKEIIGLITNTIEPASWSLNGGKGMIAAREGMLGDIVVTHVLDVHRRVEDLLSALRSSADIQVCIEARFISVSNNFLEAFGNNINEFESTQKSEDSKKSSIFTETGDKFIDTGTTNVLGAATGINLTYQIFDGFFLKGFLKAVQESDEAETVTAPKITLSNTQRGTIKVVTTTSYIERYTIVSQTPQPVMAEIDDGTTFSVRPVVSADRKYVYLEVHPVITSVKFTDTIFQTVGSVPSGGGGSATANNTIQRPTTVKQELSVTVCVPDKGILMIGGLGKSSETKTSNGIPILSKIPFIKRLFSSNTTDRDITTAGNLIILIKPTILIRAEKEGRAFAHSKGNEKIKFPTYGN
jgi:type II secretory pathway component HofQ